MIDVITFPLRMIAYFVEFGVMAIRHQITWGAVVTRADEDQFYSFKGAAIDELRAKWRMPYRTARKASR